MKKDYDKGGLPGFWNTFGIGLITGIVVGIGVGFIILYNFAVKVNFDDVSVSPTFHNVDWILSVGVLLLVLGIVGVIWVTVHYRSEYEGL